MKLIWTYNSNTSLNLTQQKKLLLENHYLYSIKSAKDLGYYTKIYVNSDSEFLFRDIVDEIHIIDSYEDSPLFDSFKFAVLEYELGDYYLIDGDLILHSLLPTLDYDVIFDAYETNNWTVYGTTINKFTEWGIGDVIDDWSINNTPIFNCGILRINNTEFKQLYINKWKEYNNFVINHLNKIWNNTQNIKWFDPSINNVTSVGAQYLLTILAINKNIRYTPLQTKLQIKGKYYTHYSGGIKYNNPIVSNKINTYNKIKSFI